MTEGVIVGGWGFVWAAYALTLISFVVYGVFLLTKVRAERTKDANEGEPR